MPTVSTAYNLYIDDELLSSNGVVSINQAEFKPAYQPKVIVFKPKDKSFDLIIHVANYTYARGGMWYPLSFGTAESINNLDKNIQIKDLLLIGAFLMFGIYHFLMYFLRRNDRSYLVLVLLSVCALGRVAIYGDYSINYLLPWFGFNGTIVLDYLTILWFPALGIIFVNNVFKVNREKKHKYFLLLLPVILSISLVALPISAFTQFTFVYQAASVSMGAYAVFLTIRNMKKHKIESVLLFVGAIAITLSGIHDTIYQNNLIHSDYGEFSPIGFLIFILLQSLILAIRNKRAYDTLSAVTKKLEKMDAIKDEFFANTAHELRTPLNAIINISEGLYRETDGQLAKVQKENLSLVINSGKRLALIVNEILDYSKLKNTGLTLYFEGVSIQRTIEQVINEMRKLIHKDQVKLMAEISENIPLILADQNRLIQILYNLIGNAIKNTIQGTIIVKARLQSDLVIISVEDTGSGIEADRLALIFEPYFQGEGHNHRNLKGTGLGLAITKNLVELHHGNIQIDSVLNQGTVAKFTMPVFKGSIVQNNMITDTDYINLPDDEDKELSITFPYSVIGKGPVITIIDDNQVNLIGMIGILKVNNYSIQAYDQVSDFNSAFDQRIKMDLVVLDVMLPKESGYEICRNIRRVYSISEMPILMLTAKTTIEDKVEGFNAGANDYLAKPFDADEFLARVRTLTQMKESVERMRSSELQFLQAQIKPHFLYNAINTFITIMRYDAERAAKLMTSFSQYLRLSFDFKDGSQTTSLKEEIALLKVYLEIEEARFEERLDVQMTVTDRLDIQVPKLVLQPIVENAIIHGVLPKVEGGRIEIVIEESTDKLEFYVKDNGVGFDGNRMINKDKDDEQNSVGIHNIHSRLKALYGSGLVIESEINIGTCVSWQIPFERR